MVTSKLYTLLYYANYLHGPNRKWYRSSLESRSFRYIMGILDAVKRADAYIILPNEEVNEYLELWNTH